MNITHKWWLAAALMCLSAVGVQRARAQEVGPASTTSSAPSSTSASSCSVATLELSSSTSSS